VESRLPVRLALYTLALTAILASSGGTTMTSDSEARLRAMIDVLPPSLEGWQKAEVCEVYTPDDLHRYINGGAELYISYRFETLISQPYVRDDDEIRLDVFDMGSSASAFGVFSHSREAVDDFVAPDVESEYAGGLLTFWKGRFCASILAYPETEAKKNLVQELARRIAAQIDEASPKPAVVSLLPEADLVSHSDRFFWHHAWINDYHFFTNENLLNLGGQVEAVMAKYRPTESGRKPAVLLAVQYPDADAAAAAHTRFSAALLPAAEDGLAQQDDGNWLGCRRDDDLLIVVADAAERETAVSLIETCAQRRDQEPTGRP
jgi:hypothetical protein